METDYLFCFVRNPYTRLLSCYLDKIARGHPEKANILRFLKLNDNDLSYELSFTDFVNAVVQQDPFDMDPHWRIQTEQCFLNYINYSYIGRFESFAEDIIKILDAIFSDLDSVEYYEHTWHATSTTAIWLI